MTPYNKWDPTHEIFNITKRYNVKDIIPMQDDILWYYAKS